MSRRFSFSLSYRYNVIAVCGRRTGERIMYAISCGPHAYRAAGRAAVSMVRWSKRGTRSSFHALHSTWDCLLGDRMCDGVTAAADHLLLLLSCHIGSTPSCIVLLQANLNTPSDDSVAPGHNTIIFITEFISFAYST